MFKRFNYILCAGILSLACITGCSAGGKSPSPEEQKSTRGSKINVLVPDASGKKTYGNNTVDIDASNTGEGYLMVRYNGSNKKVKFQFVTPDDITYSYFLKSGKYQTFPITGGKGKYQIQVLENVSGDQYAVAYTDKIKVGDVDAFKPYLYPNQYAWFTKKSETVKKGGELASTSDTDLDVINNVYDYTINNIAYDEDKAQNVSTTYLPDVDETLKTGKGICFDYAALMTAMLRSQGIPTKLEVGYSGEAYHAWISTYTEETGWVDNIIEFDGKDWHLLDPTLAANNEGSAVAKYVGDGSNYTVKFSY